jgi:hypothetical protein
MILIDFPLTGMYAEIAMGLEFLVAFVSLQLSIVYIQRIRKYPSGKYNFENYGFLIFFFFFAITITAFNIAGFLVEIERRENIMFIGYMSMLIGMFGYVSSVEYENKEKNLPIFSLIVFTFIVVGIFCIIYQKRVILMYSAYIVALPIVIHFITKKFKELRTQLKFNRSLLMKGIIEAIGGFLICFGYTFQGEYFVDLLGIKFRLFADSLMLIGIYMVLTMVILLPEYKEFEWQEKIQAVFLVKESGLPLFSRFYTQLESEEDQASIISAVISTIQMISKSITKQLINEVEFKNKVLIFSYNEKMQVNLCLIVEEQLKVYSGRIAHFFDKVETMYGELISVSSNETSLFKPLKSICDEVFHPLIK